MDYELAAKLKEAGFPKTKHPCDNCFRAGTGNACSNCGIPTLEELIEACHCWINIYGDRSSWYASPNTSRENKNIYEGITPSEAVARLWLSLHPLDTDKQ